MSKEFTSAWFRDLPNENRSLLTVVQNGLLIVSDFYGRSWTRYWKCQQRYRTNFWTLWVSWQSCNSGNINEINVCVLSVVFSFGRVASSGINIVAEDSRHWVLSRTLLLRITNPDLQYQNQNRPSVCTDEINELNKRRCKTSTDIFENYLA